MNVSVYRAARDEAEALIRDHHLPNPYADRAHARLRELRDVMEAAPQPEHGIKWNCGDIADQLECNCGWKSSRFWDGWFYALDQWYDHVAEEMGIVPKKCVCGKEYVPADGCKACHAVVEVTS
jgi:hypothetical protein